MVFLGLITLLFLSSLRDTLPATISRSNAAKFSDINGGTIVSAIDLHRDASKFIDSPEYGAQYKVPTGRPPLNGNCNPWHTFDCNVIGTRPPVIGIVSQLLVPPPRDGVDKQFIAASYVKYVESSGGMVVPVLLHFNESYYYDYMSKLNGILFPGGDADIDNGSYADSARIIYRIALEMNRNGSYFPIWGTCQGFELISDAHVGHNWLTTCNSRNTSLNLVFTSLIDRSRLFGQYAPRQVLIDLYSKTITTNEHGFCLTYENFTDSGLDKDFNMLSTTLDLSGRTFVSSFEHRAYPIYAVQFHPEKPVFEPNFGYLYPHSSAAVRAGQYMSWFFVNECRKNANKFDDEKELYGDLMENYNPAFTGKGNNGDYAYWQQLYIFPYVK